MRVAVADDGQAACHRDGDAAYLERCHLLLAEKPGGQRDDDRIECDDQRALSGADVLQAMEETQGIEEDPGHRKAGHHTPLGAGLRTRNPSLAEQGESGQHQPG